LKIHGRLRCTQGLCPTARKRTALIRAALEKARGETAALRSLANAARMMDDNPNLLQLRALQALADSGGNTLVLGLPNASIPLVRLAEKASVPPRKEPKEEE
jgi:hypothetical protein